MPLEPHGNVYTEHQHDGKAILYEQSLHDTLHILSEFGEVSGHADCGTLYMASADYEMQRQSGEIRSVLMGDIHGTRDSSLCRVVFESPPILDLRHVQRQVRDRLRKQHFCDSHVLWFQRYRHGIPRKPHDPHTEVL